jgi:hypothetical protein
MGSREKIRQEVATAQIDTTCFTIRSDVEVNNILESDLYRGKTKLLELIHFQELDLKIAWKGDDVTSMTGALDLVRWDELNLARATVQNIVVKSGVFDASQFETQLSLHQQANKKWNLIYTLWLNSVEKDQSRVERAQSISMAVLNSLGTDLNNNTQELRFDQLTEVDRALVKEVAYETLCQKGGHDLKMPMLVVVDGESMVTLRGKLGAKPRRAKYDKEDTILTGKFRGFINDHRRRALFFSAEEADIEIGFVEEQVKNGLVNLEIIASLNLGQIVCNVNAKVSLDGNGKNVYEFESMAITTPEPVIDLLTVEQQ